MSKDEIQNWRTKIGINSLFFDGASKGNLGIAGAGGVIYDSNGNKKIEYACGIGRATNNEAEWYVVIKGLELAKDMGIEKLSIIGDSLIVIREARKIYKHRKSPSSRMDYMLSCLCKEFRTINFLHVLRSQNQQTDSMANKGAGLSCGVLEKDSIRY